MHPFDYTLNSIILERVYEFNDLGVIVTSDLSWNKHISLKVAKASQMLGLIKRGIGHHAPMQVKKLFYISLVRSVLSYGSVVWAPNKEDLARLESIQRRATKYILNEYTDSYKNRLISTGLIPFSYLKESYDVIFLFKCLNNY